MIKYRLRCSHGHEFETWFQSSAAYEKLAKRRQLTCAQCGTDRVEKALMAPSVTKSSSKSAAAKPISDGDHAQRAALGHLRAKLIEGSENVGTRFAEEARRIQDDEAPARAIHGEATMSEAKSLLEDGIPVLPLPRRPQDLS